jgi:GT2 family glycosyltransferase
MEIRKGFDIFVEAARHLPPGLPVTFLGKDTRLGDGPPASDEARRVLAGRPVTLLTRCNQEEALAYLRGPGRLAVMPSLMDNYPFTVIECAALGVPFLASAVGGVPEMLDSPEVQKNLLFEPTAIDLRRCLLAYLDAPAARRAAWQQRVAQAASPVRNNRRLVEHYRSLLDAPPLVHAAPRSTPLVSAAVTHYNLGDYLPATLASLAAQDYPNLDVIVVDDGSTCERSRKVLKEQQQRYPHFRFVEQPNAGVGAARNRGLAEARGDYLVLMDADNLARPHMIRTMVEGMERNPELSALACYALGFRDEAAIAANRFEFLTAFAGGPFVLSCFENVFGDTNAIYRVEALRSIGGCANDRASPWEDWMTFVRLAWAGHKLDVIPECLFYYRVRSDGRRLAMNRGRTDQYRLTQQLLRSCFLKEKAPPAREQAELWTALVSFGALCAQRKPLLYRAADKLYHGLRRIPFLFRGLKSLSRWFGRARASGGG